METLPGESADPLFTWVEVNLITENDLNLSRSYPAFYCNPAAFLKLSTTSATDF